MSDTEWGNDWNPEWGDPEGPEGRFIAGDAEAGKLPPAPEFSEGMIARFAPLVAIVGRPNVGKSRLFNRMTGTRFAIVEDVPGVTRDRQYGEGAWSGRSYQVVDTGGFEPDSTDVLLKQMREQAQLAMEEAEIIFFVMDGRAGVTPSDREIADMLRRSEQLVVPIVNKIDGPRHMADVGEFYELGFPVVYPLSAEHGLGYEDLMDNIVEFLPKKEETAIDESIVKVAVLGKPNAGKSTLINRVIGKDRLLTSDVPGTTRDAINTWLKHDEQPYLFIDTAGVRRKRSISETVEKYSVVQAFKAIDRCDVVLYVIDATKGVTGQDQRICGMAHDKGRAVVLVLNKWDKVEKDHTTAGKMVKKIREDLKFTRYAPVITISALTGQRVYRLFPLIRSAHTEYTRRVPTSQWNRFIEATVRRTPPPIQRNRRLKIYYATQVSTRPPTLMLVVNDPDLMHFSYQRYLQNSIRREFGFEGTPVKLFSRGRTKKDNFDD